jgi:glycosyltransferase involved in cell wall biosynthesis
MTQIVSAIMPTIYARKQYLPDAIGCFLSQTYAEKELLILDDIDDPDLHDMIPKAVHIKYYRQPRANIGTKLNRLCELATGDIIMRFDDDDWSAPERMDDQVRRLRQTTMPVTGYNALFFYDTITGNAWQYRGWKGYACGTSLCFLRSWWKTNRFPEIPIGSDNHLVRKAAGRITSCDAGRLMVARNHAGSSNKRHLVEDECWKPIPVSVLPAEFLALERVTV